jgi:DNA-binding NtrC family response regulator
MKEDRMAKVLVVDDDESLRMLYSRELTNEGHEVETVPSGKDAIESIKVSRPDIVVLDIKMEGMDGLSVLEEIMKLDKTIPVILNTAYSTFKSDFTTWSADAYVVKSSDLSELKQTIDQVVQSA